MPLLPFWHGAAICREALLFGRRERSSTRNCAISEMVSLSDIALCSIKQEMRN